MSSQRRITFDINHIFFESYPSVPKVYVFDSTYLPTMSEAQDKQEYDLIIDELLNKLIDLLPDEPFSLVVFSSGLTRDISWVYAIKMYAKLPPSVKNNLLKLYIVHESFWIRSVIQVLRNALEANFFKSSSFDLVHVSNLNELTQHMDITKLRISLNVYLYDYQFNQHIAHPPIFNREYRQVIFEKIFKRLTREAPKTSLVFQKPGSQSHVNILWDVIQRCNYIDLSQWDIYSMGSIFLLFLKNKSKPLIPIDVIELPIKDDVEYTKSTLNSMMAVNEYYPLLDLLMSLLLSMLESPESGHDLRSLSKCLATSLCQEKMSYHSSDRLAIGTRFIRNLLQFWTEIANDTPPELPRRPEPRIECSPEKSPSRSMDNLASPTRSREVSSPTKEDIALLSRSMENLSSSGTLPKGPRLFASMESLRPESPTRSSSRLDSPTKLKRAPVPPPSRTRPAAKMIVESETAPKVKPVVTHKYSESYSNITGGSKVSQLAALYEERFLGVQALKELR